MWYPDTRLTNLDVTSVGNNNSQLLSERVSGNPGFDGINQAQSQYIYFDLVYNNNEDPVTGRYLPVIFEATRTQSLIERMELYKVGVISLTGNITTPIIQNYVGSTLAVTWTQNAAQQVVQLPVPWAGGGFNERASDVFSITEWIEWFNNGLNVLWGLFQAEYDNISGVPGSWQAQAGIPHEVPFVLFNDDTRCFSIYTSLDMSGDVFLNPPNPFPSPYGSNAFDVVLRVDKYTAELLWGMYWRADIAGAQGFVSLVPSPGIAGQNTELIPPDDPLNAVRYIVSSQTIPTVGLWNRTNSLVITSSFPVRKTALSLGSNFSSNSSNSRYNILESFPISITGSKDRLSEFTRPNIDYRDIMNTGPIDRFDFRVYCIDQNGNERALYVAPQSSVYLRLVFSRCTFTSN